MFILKIVLFSIVLHSLLIHSYEYCKDEAKLCWGGIHKHIMCYPEQIDPESDYQEHYLMTDKLRTLFTYWHNYFRNEVACGNVPGKGDQLPPAKQMREVIWDYELEYLAHVHAGRCRQKHDLCRNTHRVVDSGQNLAHKMTKGKPPPTPVERTQGAPRQWFAEHENVTLAFLKRYPSTHELPQPPPGVKQIEIGHFTALVNDKVGRFGCAITWARPFPDAPKQFNHTYVTCNYDYTNIITYTTYLDGASASNCGIYGSYGKSSNFSCLCAKTFEKENTTALYWPLIGHLCVNINNKLNKLFSTN